MSLSKVWWVAEPDESSRPWLSLVEFLDHCGLSYRQPGTGKIYQLDADMADQDFRREVDSLRSLEDEQDRGGFILLQLWLSRDADVLLSVDPNTRNIIEFFLDGLELDEGRAIVGMLVIAALARSATALIVDSGLSEYEEAWEYWLTNGGDLPYEPELSLLPNDDGTRVVGMRVNSWIRYQPA